MQWSVHCYNLMYKFFFLSQYSEISSRNDIVVFLEFRGLSRQPMEVRLRLTVDETFEEGDTDDYSVKTPYFFMNCFPLFILVRQDTATKKTAHSARKSLIQVNFFYLIKNIYLSERNCSKLDQIDGRKILCVLQRILNQTLKKKKN